MYVVCKPYYTEKIFKAFHNDTLIHFDTIENMKDYIISTLSSNCPLLNEIKFSSSAKTI